MNAALRAIAKLAAAQGLQVFGTLDGYDGLIDGNFRELTKGRWWQPSWPRNGLR